MSVNREGLVPVGRLEALLDKYRRDHGGHYDSTLLRAQDGADLARALRVLLAESLEEGKPVRAWHELTDAERKEWNHGVMNPESGRRTFQTFDHAYRLITGGEMPTPKQTEDWNRQNPPSPAANTEGLRAALKAEIERLAIHSISVGPVNGPMKPERAILLEWALKAIDAALRQSAKEGA